MCMHEQRRKRQSEDDKCQGFAGRTDLEQITTGMWPLIEKTAHEDRGKPIES